MVELITLVLEHCRLAQHDETVGKALRNEELPVVVLGQFYRHVLAVCRRTFAYVNGYIKHFPLYAPHQFCLCERRTLEMQTAHHAVGRHALVVLNELHMTDFLIELSLREALEKITSCVLEYAWLDDDHAFYLCLDYFHVLNTPSFSPTFLLSRPRQKADTSHNHSSASVGPPREVSLP